MFDLEIPARDNYPLAATLFHPRSEAVKADHEGDAIPPSSARARQTVIVNSATGVARRFYRRFAEFLASEGFTTLTYDYRGIGGSRPHSLRGFEARMHEWGLLDMAGVIDWVKADLTPNRLFLVGHSVGGQVAGLLDNAALVDGLVATSAQSGYWRIQGGVQKALVFFYVYLLIPTMTRLVGYFPWSTLGRGEDLPAGVALEWARWCRSPNYLFDDPDLPSERSEDFNAPILAYSIDDDDWGTRRAVDELMSHYENAPLTRRHVTPAEVGVDSIGHFGFYRTRCRPLWEEIVDWLRSDDGRALP